MSRWRSQYNIFSCGPFIIYGVELRPKILVKLEMFRMSRSSIRNLRAK